MAQLIEWSLPIPEDRDSNSVIGVRWWHSSRVWIFRVKDGLRYFFNNFILHFCDFQHTFINNTNFNNFLTNNSINNCFSASFTLSSLKVERRCYAWAKKEKSSPRINLMAQGVAYRCSKVECEDHVTIQAPPKDAHRYLILMIPNINSSSSDTWKPLLKKRRNDDNAVSLGVLDGRKRDFWFQNFLFSFFSANRSISFVKTVPMANLVNALQQ